MFLSYSSDHPQTAEEIAEFVADHVPGVFVQQNLIDPAIPLWLLMALFEGAFDLMELTAKWLRTPPTGVPQDAAMCTFHFLNITAGVPDNTWITADFTAIESAFDTFWTSLKANYASDVKLSELSWRADGPRFRPHGTDLSPTLRAVSRSVVGTAAGESLPPQIAMTVTEVTAAKFTVLDVEGVGTQVRNRWGRFYLPAPAEIVNEGGRIGAGFASAISTNVDTFYEAVVTAGFAPVLYSPTTGKAWSILETHVDDIWDVIRSRRFITPLSRNVKTLTQLVA